MDDDGEPAQNVGKIDLAIRVPTLYIRTNEHHTIPPAPPSIKSNSSFPLGFTAPGIFGGYHSLHGLRD